MSDFVDGRRWPTTSPAVAPAGDAPRRTDSDQQPAEGAPDSISALLHLPGVYVQADEDGCQVVIGLSPDVARAISGYAPNPLQVQLAAKLVDGALLDLEDAR